LAAEPEARRVVQTAAMAFEDAKQFLEAAIAQRGFVVSHYSDIGGMLQRTGTDVGSTQPVYDQAGVIEFCSAALSRKMMAADAANILFCPYAIALYTLPAQPEAVHIAYERVAAGAPEGSQQVLKEIEDLLADIVREVVEF
jgi:uncharacterized protein (DUF302 family)